MSPTAVLEVITSTASPTAGSSYTLYWTVLFTKFAFFALDKIAEGPFPGSKGLDAKTAHHAPPTETKPARTAPLMPTPCTPTVYHTESSSNSMVDIILMVMVSVALTGFIISARFLFRRFITTLQDGSATLITPPLGDGVKQDDHDSEDDSDYVPDSDGDSGGDDDDDEEPDFYDDLDIGGGGDPNDPPGDDNGDDGNDRNGDGRSRPFPYRSFIGPWLLVFLPITIVKFWESRSAPKFALNDLLFLRSRRQHTLADFDYDLLLPELNEEYITHAQERLRFSQKFAGYIADATDVLVSVGRGSICSFYSYFHAIVATVFGYTVPHRICVHLGTATAASQRITPILVAQDEVRAAVGAPINWVNVRNELWSAIQSFLADFVDYYYSEDEVIVARRQHQLMVCRASVGWSMVAHLLYRCWASQRVGREHYEQYEEDVDDATVVQQQAQALVSSENENDSQTNEGAFGSQVMIVMVDEAKIERENNKAGEVDEDTLHVVESSPKTSAGGDSPATVPVIIEDAEDVDDVEEQEVRANTTTDDGPDFIRTEDENDLEEQVVEAQAALVPYELATVQAIEDVEDGNDIDVEAVGDVLDSRTEMTSFKDENPLQLSKSEKKRRRRKAQKARKAATREGEAERGITGSNEGAEEEEEATEIPFPCMLAVHAATPPPPKKEERDLLTSRKLSRSARRRHNRRAEAAFDLEELAEGEQAIVREATQSQRDLSLLPVSSPLSSPSPSSGNLSSVLDPGEVAAGHRELARILEEETKMLHEKEEKRKEAAEEARKLREETKQRRRLEKVKKEIVRDFWSDTPVVREKYLGPLQRLKMADEADQKTGGEERKKVVQQWLNW